MATTKNGRTTPSKTMTFDPERLEVGDLMDLEDHFGITFMALSKVLQGTQLEDLTSKHLGAFTFLIMRLKDPNFAPEDVRKIRVNDLKAMTSSRTMSTVKQRLAKAGGAGDAIPEDFPAGD